MRRKLLLLCITCMLLALLTPLTVFSATVPVLTISSPSGQYWYNAKGKLVDSSGLETSLAEDIKKQLSLEVSSKFSQIVSNQTFPTFFKTTYPLKLIQKDGVAVEEYVTGSLSLSEFSKFTAPSTVEVNTGSRTYLVYIPTKEESNSILSLTLGYLDQVRAVVDSTVLELTLGSSLNLYSFYPDQQIRVTDLVDFSGANGVIKGNQKVTYSLDKLAHPLLGFINAKDVDTTKLIQTSAMDRSKTISVDENDKPSEYRYNFNPAVVNFINNTDNSRTMYTEIAAAKVNTKTGLKEYKMSLTGTTLTLKHFVDSTLRVAMPSVYTLSGRGSTNTYSMDDTTGFKVLEGVKLSVTTNMAYIQKADGSFESPKDYEAFGIDQSKLVVSKIDIGGAVVGVVIPLAYKEAVYVGKGDNIYYTGREFIFNGAYKTGINLQTSNSSIFGISDPASGLASANLRLYAFPKGANYENGATHTALETTPTEFELKPTFNVNADGYGGFTLFINNMYATDPVLVSWLGQDKAKSITGVKAEQLLGYINGTLDDTNDTKFLYTEWERLHAIQDELKESKGDTLVYILTLVSTVVGIGLGFFGVLLFFGYWIDYLNLLSSVTGILFLKLVSGGRLEVNPEKLGALDFSSERGGDGVAYVFFGRILILLFVCFILATFFTNISIVISAVAKLYFIMSRILGGV